MAYAPLTKIPQQFFDNLGNPLVSGTLYAYLAGTSTPTNMFSDNAGTVAGTSVVLDSRGEPTTFKLIWLNTAVIYKFVLKDSTGTTIWTIDNISGDDGTGNTASSVFDQQTLTATAGQTLFTLGYSYVTGTNAMAVYKNGSRLITGTDFTETSSTSVTLTMAAIAGDEYTFIGGQDVSSSFSGTNVSFIQSGTGAVQRNVQNKLRDTVSVKDFGAVGDGSTDDTAAIQAAVDYVQSVGATDPYDPTFSGDNNIGRLNFPAGVYKITSPINITKPCVIFGDGIRRTIIRFSTSNTALFAFNIGPTVVGQNMIGGSFGDMSIICNAGSAVGNGIYMSTAASSSGTTLYVLHDLGIYNVRIGVSQTGVIYMCTFRNITVAGTFGGSVGIYGWYVTSPQEVIYNSYTDLEVTSVGDGAYAYWFQVLACQFRNLTADGVAYFSNPYGAVKGFTIEGINATTTPSSTAIQLNQCDALEDVALISCPTAKTNIGISVIGRSNICNVRWPDNGAGNQPATPLYLFSGSKGTVTGWQVGRAVTNKVEAGSAIADMNNWVFTACSDITDYDLTYKIGTWTPTYPSGWTSAPTTISAQYTRIGRQVTVTLYATDGVANAGAVIGGLPFASNSTQGAAAYGGSSDTTDSIRGSIIPSSSTINNIPALTLTGNFWQITATYFV